MSPPFDPAMMGGNGQQGPIPQQQQQQQQQQQAVPGATAGVFMGATTPNMMG